MRWLFLITIFLSLSSFGQRNKYVILSSTMFASGMIDGTVETISHHYSYFKNRLPEANDKYWNPQVSWVNKYKNGNPNLGPKFTGSMTVLAWTTDGYHMLRTSKRMIDFGTLAYWSSYEVEDLRKVRSRKERFREFAIDFLMISVARSVGFTLTYNLVFRK
jgi:hypothetical protein